MNKWLFIFDLDGTLYDLNDVIQMSYHLQVAFLSMKKGITEDESVQYLASHHVYPIMKKDSKSATELFMDLGYDKCEWAGFREAGFDVSRINKDKAVKEETLKKFSNYGNIVLLSSNSYKIVKSILLHIGINQFVFDKIICSDRFPYDEPFKKKKAIAYLSEKYCIPMHNVISIGDRFTTDILPALELGAIGILLRSPMMMPYVFHDIMANNLKTGNYYELYYKLIDR